MHSFVDCSSIFKLEPFTVLALNRIIDILVLAGIEIPDGFSQMT